MSQKSKQQDDALEELLVSLFGVILVMVATAGVYFLVVRSASGGFDKPISSKVQFWDWVWGIFGILFFVYGAVGVVRGKINVGWTRYSYQIYTTLDRAGALVASAGMAIGGLLLMTVTVIYFDPLLGAVIDPWATLLCGFASIIIGWICGLIIQALGY
jgi:hypothetical protein